MPLNFPTSPTQDDEYVYQSVLYVFTGTKWQLANIKHKYAGSEFSSQSSITIDLATGNIFSIVANEPTTITFINPPALGYATKFQISIENINSNSTMTWPSNVLFAGNSVAFVMPDLNETDIFEFYTSDAGQTYYANKLQDDIR